MGNYQRLLAEEYGVSPAAGTQGPEVSQQGQLANDILADLAEVGDSLNNGEYSSMEAYREIVDIVRSYQPFLDDVGNQALQGLAFGYAKDSGVDFEQALEVWRSTEQPSMGGQTT